MVLMITGRLIEADVTVPKVTVTARLTAVPSPTPPDVGTVIVQGSTLTTFPVANGDVAGNVDAVTVKMHEPKVVAPVAWKPPLLTVNPGAVVPVAGAVNAREVEPVTATGAPVASTPENPFANVTGATGTAVVGNSVNSG